MVTKATNMRKNVRANLNVQVVLTGTDREGKPFSIAGQSLDFSRKGLGVLLDQDIAAPGSIVAVSSANKFHSNATIQWIARDQTTGRFRVGLRLLEPKSSVGFKIAASILLCWAFLQQISFAGSGGFSQAAPARSSTVSVMQAQPPHIAPGVLIKELESSSAQNNPQPADQGLDSSEADDRTWVQQAMANAAENRDKTGHATLDIQMSKESYGAGEMVMANEFRLSNPSQFSRSIEMKSWLSAPGIAPISVGNVGADGLYVLPPGLGEDYGPVRLLSVASDLPAGEYVFSARMIDPITGDVLGEKLKSFALSTSGTAMAKAAEEAPLLNISLQLGDNNYTYGDTVSLSQCRIANRNALPAAIELKMWLEVPGMKAIEVFSLGADGSLVLTPGSDMNIEPMKQFEVTNDLPAGRYQLKCRAMNPITGQTFYETASAFEIR